MVDEKILEYEAGGSGGGFFLLVLHRPEDVLRLERQIVNAHVERIGDGVADGGGRRRKTGLAKAFGAVGSLRLGTLKNDWNHLRHVERGESMKTKKRRMAHFAGLLDDNFLVQRRADA